MLWSEEKLNIGKPLLSDSHFRPSLPLAKSQTRKNVFAEFVFAAATSAEGTEVLSVEHVTSNLPSEETALGAYGKRPVVFTWQGGVGLAAAALFDGQEASLLPVQQVGVVIIDGLIIIPRMEHKAW